MTITAGYIEKERREKRRVSQYKSTEAQWLGREGEKMARRLCFTNRARMYVDVFASAGAFITAERRRFLYHKVGIYPL